MINRERDLFLVSSQLVHILFIFSSKVFAILNMNSEENSMIKFAIMLKAGNIIRKVSVDFNVK